MGFVIGAVVSLIVVFLLVYITIKKPTFGKVVIALALVMVITAVFFYFQEDNRVEKKKHLIPLEQVELSTVEHKWSYGNFYKLNAEIKNNSPRYRLQSIILQISLFKCPTPNNCQSVLQLKHKIDTRLAAQQSKKIDSHILLEPELFAKNLSESKKDKTIDVDSLQWKIKLLEVNARR
ncbi:hypothetical protein [sulfur-oxidizing endosymbiont of Gigantopelta aegis]|uniref:hypothetical protein n=1 Tax=sulfur-oxidizing endosymbiont of Gigantopelta aegis TaxID=2794934 RepID=UPI0018DE4164|nr:hypothetical protein [sulfur-oxidizing endosymbiont of Gigantopelta aegis]